VAVPKVGGEFLRARIEEIGVVDRFVGRIILGMDAMIAALMRRLMSFETSVTRATRVFLLQRERVSQNRVVRSVTGQVVGSP